MVVIFVLLMVFIALELKFASVCDASIYQLKSHPELYEGYVPMAYDDYLKNISKYGAIPHLNFLASMFFIKFGSIHISMLDVNDYRTGEWGDHVTLQAAADAVLSLPLSLSLSTHTHTRATCKLAYLAIWRT